MSIAVSNILNHSSMLIKFADKITQTKSKSFNFKKVSDSFYRGSDPSNNLEGLYKKGIKVVLNLKTISPKEYKKLANEAKKLGIKYVNVPLNPLSIKSNINDILKVLNNTSKEKPLFVHCTFGRDRTGFVTALYKILKLHTNMKDAIIDMHQNGFRKIFFNMEHYLKTNLQ